MDWLSLLSELVIGIAMKLFPSISGCINVFHNLAVNLFLNTVESISDVIPSKIVLHLLEADAVDSIMDWLSELVIGIAMNLLPSISGCVSMSLNYAMNISSSINNTIESTSNVIPSEVVLHLLLLEIKVPHAFAGFSNLASGVFDLVVDVVLLSKVIEGVDSIEDLGSVFVVRFFINCLPETRGLIS
jgi:phage-related protein